jgi:flagellar basal body-associated protein FliL
MAEEEDAAEESKGGEGEGKGKLTLMVLVLNTVGLLGLAAFVVMGGGGGGGGSNEQMMMAAEAMAEGALASDAPGVIKSTGAPGPMVDVGTLVVNLKEPGGGKYLKAKINLELDSDDTLPEVEARLSQVKYQLTMLLSGQRVVDVQGPEAMEALRKSMIRRANAVLSKGRVVGVWPEEWIVQ